MIRFYCTLFFATLLPALLLLSFDSPGQDSSLYTMQHFTTENGLPQNSIKAIIQDDYGFMWIATEAGLLRYDGRHFIRPGGENNDLLGGRFIEIRKGLKDDAWYAVADYRELLRIKSGKTWRIGKWLNDLFPYRVEHTDLYNNTWGHTRLNGIPTPDSFQLHLSATTAAIITRKGIICWYREGRQVAQTTVPAPCEDYTRFFNLKGELYFLPKGPGQQYLYALGEKAYSRVPLTGDILKEKRVTERILCFNPGNEIAFLYSDKNWYLLEKTEGRFSTTLILSNFDLLEHQVCSGYYDVKLGRFWLGSKTKGLYVFNKRSFISRHSVAKSGFGNVVYEQVPLGDSAIFTGKGVVFSPFSMKLPKAPVMNIEAVDYGNTIVRARDSSILSGTLNGLYQYVPGSIIPQYRLDFPWRFSWSEGLGPCLWLSTYAHGIYRYNTKTPYKQPELVLDTKEYVLCVAQESENILWAGSEKNLLRIDLARHKADTIPELKNKVSRGLYLSRPGELWICTYGSGLYLMQDNKVTHFPIDKKECLKAVHKILEDSNGFFWISTNNGLFQVRKQDLLHYAADTTFMPYYQYYDKSEGFLTNEFNGGSAQVGVKMGCGYFSFSSIDGVVFFDPLALVPELPDRPMVVDAIEVDGHRLGLDSGSIILPPTFSRVNIYYSTAYMGNATNLHYEYRVSNRDGKTDWLPFENEMLSFSSFTIGENTITVRKKAGFGPDNYTYNTVSLYVPPQWFQTWWFRACIFILAILLVWLFIHLRVKYLQHKNRLLEEMVKTRTGELNDAVRILEFSEKELGQELRFHRRLNENITHDVQTPLKYLVLSMKHLFSKAEKKEQLSSDDIGQVYHSVHRIYHFTRNLTDYMKARLDASKHGQVNLYELVAQKIDIFLQAADDHSDRLINEVDKGLYTECHPYLLDVILHNILDNAIKFTRNGMISIKASQRLNITTISISDTGNGLDTESVKWYNHYLNHPEEQQDDKPVGLGFRTIQESLELIRGKILISSQKGKGTTFIIELIDYRAIEGTQAKP